MNEKVKKVLILKTNIVKLYEIQYWIGLPNEH